MPVFPSVIPQYLFIDPIANYGCAFDHRVTFDGACSTSANTTITSATANFTNADLNKRITLAGAGTSGAMYVGTVSAIVSTTSVTVTPAIGTTVSSAGLQIHTDDITAWTNLINDINNSPYPGAVIHMRNAGVSGAGTNRSGISTFLPTINKQVRFEGIAASSTADTGDYTKGGGTCIAYVGTSNASTAFGAVMTIAPSLGTTAQNLKQVTLSHLWIDCRNGGQNPALKGLSLQSCAGWQIDDFFVCDPAGVGIEFLVVGPGVAVGNAGSLGEAKDCTRGNARNVRFRCLDSPSGSMTTPILMTSAVLMTTTGQSLTVAANTLTSSGYIWTETTLGTPLLINYTGGGGTTTLTGCTVSAQDANTGYTTVNGGNVVQAVPGNSCAILLDGDNTSNTCLNSFDTIIIFHGSTWGPAAVEFRNSDSNTTTNLVINGGSSTNGGAINRVTKPGVRLNGHTSSIFHSRNNTFKDGSAGAGGLNYMGVNSSGAVLTYQSTANTWDNYQLGNGEAIPVIEGNSYNTWTGNGCLISNGTSAPVAIAGQALTAATQTLISGSLLAIPPQGFQIGTCLRWTIRMTKTAAGAAIPGTFLILINTTGTSAGAGTVATMALTSVGTAVADTGTVVIDFTVRSLGSAAAGVAHLVMTHGLQTTGWMAVQMQEIDATMATWNSTVSQQFIMVTMTSGAAVVPTITQCYLEIIKGANP